MLIQDQIRKFLFFVKLNKHSKYFILIFKQEYQFHYQQMLYNCKSRLLDQVAGLMDLNVLHCE